jgi:hypothetical protein
VRYRALAVGAPGGTGDESELLLGRRLDAA